MKMSLRTPLITLGTVVAMCLPMGAGPAGVALAGIGLEAAEIIEQILVKVNGEIFTKSDLEQRQIAALRQRNRGVSETDLKNDAELRKALTEITPQIVLQAVDELLLLQRAKELNLALTDERFNEILAKIRKENKLEDDQAFEAALKNEGLTVAELRRSMERDMLISEVQRQDVMQKIAVSEEEARAYYEAHKSEFTSQASVTLREIFVNVPDKAPPGSPNAGQAGVNVGLEEEAKEKIDTLRQRALKGEDFAKLAAEGSDAASKANGGLIGPIKKEELSAAAQQTIEGLKPGGVSEPIRLAKGWQIIKLESATQTVIQPLDQVRDQVSNKVFMSKRGAEMEKYVKRLRSQAVIEWKNDEIHKAYERALAEEAKEPAPPAAPGRS
jgi:peptidyl-prolyl cis-trans isomerase SurA